MAGNVDAKNLRARNKALHTRLESSTRNTVANLTRPVF